MVEKARIPGHENRERVMRRVVASRPAPPRRLLPGRRARTRRRGPRHRRALRRQRPAREQRHRRDDCARLPWPPTGRHLPGHDADGQTSAWCRPRPTRRMVLTVGAHRLRRRHPGRPSTRRCSHERAWPGPAGPPSAVVGRRAQAGGDGRCRVSARRPRRSSWAHRGRSLAWWSSSPCSPGRRARSAAPARPAWAARLLPGRRSWSSWRGVGVVVATARGARARRRAVRCPRLLRESATRSGSASSGVRRRACRRRGRAATVVELGICRAAGCSSPVRSAAGDVAVVLGVVAALLLVWWSLAASHRDGHARGGP